MAGKQQASRSSGGANDASSSSSTAESLGSNAARGATTGKEEENNLKKAFMTGPLDPYASFCSFTKADEFDVFSATVASNVANEDRILVDPARGLFGVFDGHGGKDVASFALERIGPLFDKQYAKKSRGDADDVVSLFFEAASSAQKQKKAAAAAGGSKVGSGDEPGAALKRAFVEIDEEFLNQHGRRLPTTGSCGLVCYIERGVVWSAIVGDSRLPAVRSQSQPSVLGVF
uniref:PPM-type phosphatase domain-containing protein n=1 Tax=Cryptomonas curvata TaxID=233186 RepID=A0A7S0NBD2_9CRYP